MYGVCGFWTASPMPMAGMMSDHVDAAVHSRPPKIGGMNE